MEIQFDRSFSPNKLAFWSHIVLAYLLLLLSSLAIVVMAQEMVVALHYGGLHEREVRPLQSFGAHPRRSLLASYRPTIDSYGQRVAAPRSDMRG
jgi:hypothetical protein